MSRQNRVNPFGDLVATPCRGTLMGNRGCLHDDYGAIRKPFARKAWVTCRLEWKGIRRSVFSPGRYSELFFLDEATALAAGHRPCNDCRSEAYKAFNAAFSVAMTGGSKVKADAMDLRIHDDRMSREHAKRTFSSELGSLPDGVIVVLEEALTEPRLLWKGRLLRWSFDGYSDAIRLDHGGAVQVLTPASISEAIKAGYPVKVHPSAEDLT